MVFALMLAEPEEPARDQRLAAVLVWGAFALLIAAVIFGGLSWLGVHGKWVSPTELANDGSLAAIGRALLTTYSLAFELISLALLVAILGALAIARQGREKT
jgi:NADH-quinone oxidoreductase subunit J